MSNTNWTWKVVVIYLYVHIYETPVKEYEVTKLRGSGGGNIGRIEWKERGKKVVNTALMKFSNNNK